MSILFSSALHVLRAAGANSGPGIYPINFCLPEHTHRAAAAAGKEVQVVMNMHANIIHPLDPLPRIASQPAFEYQNSSSLLRTPVFPFLSPDFRFPAKLLLSAPGPAKETRCFFPAKLPARNYFRQTLSFLFCPPLIGGQLCGSSNKLDSETCIFSEFKKKMLDDKFCFI